MSDDPNIDAYFERIGFSGSIAPSLETLEALQQLHPAAIPFEALDPLMGAPVRLELKNLEQKLLFDRRGGYCFEQNLLFKAVLEDLGYPVKGLAARVNWNHPLEEERPLSHMVLLVEVNGADYLADVGFGSTTLTAPLRMRADAEQATPHGTFRLLSVDGGWRLEAQIGEEWRPVYSFDETEKTFEDYVALNDFVASDSNFRDNLIASRADKGRRIGLRNRQLRIHTIGGETETRTLGSIGEVKDVLANLIGIALPPAEKLDPALTRALGEPAA